VTALDPAIASAIASAFERVAQELRASAGIKLALLREPDAECPPRADEREKEALMSAPQVAEFLNLNARTFRRYRADETLGFPSPIKIGRVLRWRRRDVERWMKERTP
jgi:predicted DNA-binding transcriptional regulator AlpA